LHGGEFLAAAAAFACDLLLCDGSGRRRHG
jgi:hypothetical protein